MLLKIMDNLRLGVLLIALASGLCSVSRTDAYTTIMKTGWETNEIQGIANTVEYSSNVTGYNNSSNPPPQCSRRYNQIRNNGNYSLLISGYSQAASAYCYYRVFTRWIKVVPGMKIGYWIYHDQGSVKVAVDGHFTNGETIRNFGSGAIRDQYGVRIHPSHRKDPKKQWYYVEVDLTPAAGKAIDYIMFGFDNGGDGFKGKYRTFVDDFRIFVGSSCWTNVPYTSWKGDYFDNNNLSGSPVMSRDDGIGAINFDWGGSSPDASCGVPADNFSVRWTRTAIVEENGEYEFSVTSDDGLRFYVDNVLVLDKWLDRGMTTDRVILYLERGKHILRLEYYERAGAAVAGLAWQKFKGFGQPTLGDYWEGKAEWRLERLLTQQNTGWPHDAAHGTDIKIVNGVWYLFSRKKFKYWNPRLQKEKEANGTEVRMSTDEGRTWSAPVDVLIPEYGTPWEFHATDGSAYYDPIRNEWHLLFQCVGYNEGWNQWNGCHAKRTGPDPMGLFEPDPSPLNPVIKSGELWGRICSGSEKDCYRLSDGRPVKEEGTFDIFHFDGEFFWVAFHGHTPETIVNGQYKHPRGYRGIAKTRDFIDWIAGDEFQGVPADAIVDRDDAIGWRESWQFGGPIGAGAGSIVYESGYYYLIVEVPDTSLACKAGQNWDLGLFRSPSLTNTNWEQLPEGNPIVYSSRMIEPGASAVKPCNVQYPHLFKDPGTGITYLMFTRVSRDPAYNGIYLYRLHWKDNLLKNSDFWMGSTSHWRRGSQDPTNYAVYRSPNFSTDGNQYLAMNCGQVPCQSGQSVFQDVDVSAYRGYPFSYGGKFATDGWGTGTIELVVYQLDENFGIVQSNSVRINATPEYYSINQDGGIINHRTKFLRYQMYLRSPANPNDPLVTFRADELYLKVPLHLLIGRLQ